MIGELLHLLTDPAHWAFEVVTDLILGAVGALAVRPLVRRHDRRHHSVDPVQVHAYEGPDGLLRPQPSRPNPTPHRMNCELPAFLCGHPDHLGER
jgi:hypothetical protein